MATRKDGATYNDVLNEQGTAAYLTAKHKDSKTGRLVKALVYIPTDKVDTLNAHKGWNLPATAGQLVIRGGEPCMYLVMDGTTYTGTVYAPDYSQQTARGKRLHEKLKESAVDYLSVYGKLSSDAITFVQSDAMTPAPDPYKQSTEYTIDDLLDL